MELQPEHVEGARQRAGDPASDRPEYVDESLQPAERLGYVEGLPLVPAPADAEEGTYHHYDIDWLAEPDEAREFLSELTEHDWITNVSALAKELGLDEDDAAELNDLYSLDLPRNGFDVTGFERPTDKFVFPDGEEWPIESVDGENVEQNAIVLTVLLGKCGMSCDEAAHYLSDEKYRLFHEADCPESKWRVYASDIRSAAREHGLLPADDSGETAGRQSALTPNPSEVTVREEDLPDGVSVE